MPKRSLPSLLVTSFCFFLFLSGCASLEQTTTRNQIKQAKLDYDAEKYEQSLRALLPIAQQGNPKAQYAVGYMYYYGKGVAQNIQLAKSWIRNAAEQGYTPARNALNLINNYDAAYTYNDAKLSTAPTAPLSAPTPAQTNESPK